ncbi:MAG: hypothetical protein ACI8QS_001965 [Planctomycetota bacterium]|jgi:hypothetical protein
MLRSFGNRPDSIVCDEPLYSHYLRSTGLPHPGAAEIIAEHESDWHAVVNWLTGPVEVHGSPGIFYQKHMAHHLVGGIEREWVSQLDNCFLIRDPREMLLSLTKVTPNPGPLDTGLPQLLELFESERERLGHAPPVIDGRDVLEDPRGVLSALCDRLGIPFVEEMLSWPKGQRETDGVWAKHWYASVERSTGFQSWHPREEALDPKLEPVLAAVLPAYEALHAHRLLA